MQSSISSTQWKEGDTITLTATPTNMEYHATIWVINYTSSDLNECAGDLIDNGKVFAYDIAETEITQTVTSSALSIHTLTPICIDCLAPHYVGQTMEMPFSALQQYNRTYEVGTTYNILHGDVVLSGIVTWLKNWFNTKEEHDSMMFTDSGWQTCSLNSGYSVYSSGTSLRVRKTGKIVQINGVFKNNSSVTSSITAVKFATIPTGYRPSKQQVKVCQGSNMDRWTLIVNSSGEMFWARYGTDSYVTASSGRFLPYTMTYMID